MMTLEHNGVTYHKTTEARKANGRMEVKLNGMWFAADACSAFWPAPIGNNPALLMGRFFAIPDILMTAEVVD